MLKTIFFVFAVSIMNQMMLKYCGLNLKLQIFVVFILQCATFHQILTLLKQKFTDSLSTVLASLVVDPNRRVLIIGDFNDHSVFKPIQLQSNLFRTLSAFGFHRFINTATRDHMILDWALTNVPSAVLSHGALDPINNLDHNPIFIELNFSLKRHVVSKPFFVWDYSALKSLYFSFVYGHLQFAIGA